MRLAKSLRTKRRGLVNRAHRLFFGPSFCDYVRVREQANSQTWFGVFSAKGWSSQPEQIASILGKRLQVPRWSSKYIWIQKLLGTDAKAV